MGDLSGRFCRLIKRHRDVCGIVGVEPLENLCDLSGPLSRSETTETLFFTTLAVGEGEPDYLWCTAKQKLETCLGVSHI